MPNVIVPSRSPKPPQTNASKYPIPNAEPIAKRANVVKRVRRKTSCSNLFCFKSRCFVTQSWLSSERSTALNSTPSCTSIWILLSLSRISSVIFLNLCEMSLPTTIITGVIKRSAHASRASNQRIIRKAPTSWIPVTAICGIVSIVDVLMFSISLESLDVTSPECSSCPSKRRRLNNEPK